MHLLATVMYGPGSGEHSVVHDPPFCLTTGRIEPWNVMVTQDAGNRPIFFIDDGDISRDVSCLSRSSPIFFVPGSANERCRTLQVRGWPHYVL